MTQKSLITDRAAYRVATDDLNPLYLDEGYARQNRHGGIIAPPLFYMAPLTDPVPETDLRKDGLPREGRFPIPPVPLERPGGVPLVDGGTEVEFFVPIRSGDRLTARTRIVDIYQKEGKSGPLVFVVRAYPLGTRRPYTNQRAAYRYSTLGEDNAQ
jgi:acyl dehydratase